MQEHAVTYYCIRDQAHMVAIVDNVDSADSADSVDSMNGVNCVKCMPTMPSMLGKANILGGCPHILWHCRTAFCPTPLRQPKEITHMTMHGQVSYTMKNKKYIEVKNKE